MGGAFSPGGSVGGTLGADLGGERGRANPVEGWPRRRGGLLREPHAGASGVSSHRFSLHWRRDWGREGS